ncbi:hypothetical protein JCM8097_000200 [Rhodosporidiobolus ruineniae]
MLSAVTSLFASELTPNEKPKWFFWYPPGTDARTKKFLFKIVKYLDQVNITSAYVSGMKEDLGFVGNELTWFTSAWRSCFTISTSVISSGTLRLTISIVPPHIWLPGCEFLWGLFTLALYKANGAKMIYALRFLIGVLEGSAFGFMTSAIYTNMHMRNGLEGWRWLFIIDAIITFGVAIFGFVFFPDTPATTKAWYLTAEEKAFAVERLIPEGRGEEFSSGGLSVFKRLFTRHWTLLVFCWIGWSNTLGKYVGTVFSLYLKNDPSRWSLYQINNIPTSSGGFNIAMMLGGGWIVDMTGRRYLLIVGFLCTQILGTVLYLIYDIGVGGQIAGLLLGAVDGPTSPIIMTWANLLLSGDAQRRALTIACMNCLGSAVSTIVNTYGYKATDAPEMRKGVGLSLAFVCFELICVTVLRFVELSSRKDREADETSSKAEEGSPERESKEKELMEGEGGEVVPVATK